MSKNYAGGLITADQNANYSGLFNGAASAGSSLSVAGAARFAIATSTTPFTVEAWVRPTAAGGAIFSEEFTSDTIAMTFGLAASNDTATLTGLFPIMGYYVGAWTNVAASTRPLLLNAWSHVAFVFTGSTSKIYINGVDATKTSAPTPATTWGVTGNNGTLWFIGRHWNTVTFSSFKGNISNFRFVNGTAVYTGNFAPPPRLSATTDTVLLTCQSSTFIDNSSYAATITNTGGIVVSQDNPYYTPSTPALGAATPGVWTISEAAAAAAQRSWPMYDPYFNLTTAMIHGNGTNGANNNTFLDSSTNNFTITRNGNTTQGTFTPFSEPDGYWSNFFDGTGDYLTVPSSTNLAFGTGNFTIECWVYFNSTTGTFVPFAQSDALGASTNNKWFFALSSATLRLQTHSTGGFTCTTPWSPTVSAWYHVAAVRNSGTILLFINGASGTVTTTGTPSGYDLGQNGVTIGAMSTPYYLNGYISNFRLLKGTALYTTSFTPPTAPLTAITNTQLLTCQSNRFADNSANNFAVTKVGDTRTLTYSPFYSPTAYTPAARGGAMYFDGTGDTITAADNNAFTLSTNDFTLELWVYPISNGNILNIVGQSDVGGGATTQSAVIYRNASNILVGYANSGTTQYACTSTDTVVSGSWYHIALVRNGTTLALYINGRANGTASIGSASVNNATSVFAVGNVGAIVTSYYSGYASNVRLINGTALYTAAFTPPTAPLTPITNTQLLLSGTNGSFIDNATNLTIETVNTTITTSQSKYGGSSMLFNGSTAYASLITPAGNGASTVPTLGDFTVEGWVYPITANAQKAIFFLNGNTSSFGVRIDHTASANIQLLVSTTGAAHAISVVSTATISTGTWSHLALVRQGPAFIVYLNGVSIITSTAVGVTTAVMAGTLSYLGVLGGLANYFFGAMSDFRITNYARYLGPFTPPTSTLQNQ